MIHNVNVQTPVRPTLATAKCEGAEDNSSVWKKNNKRFDGSPPCENSSDQERRIAQRKKQVSYGYMTEGYRNMIKLVEHDPLLKIGGIIPLSPPDIKKGSKRNWDILLRKWRRALHMFDNIYIDGDTESTETLEDIIEKQRLQWVSPVFINEPKEKRVILSSEKIREARNSPYVPKRLPVEESLKVILRSEDCYEPVSNVVPPSASSLIKGSDISHLDAGIKIYFTPSAYNHQTVTHETPEKTLSQISPQHLNFDNLTPAHVKNIQTGVQTISPQSLPFQRAHAFDASLLSESKYLNVDPTISSLFVNTHQPPCVTACNVLQPTGWQENGNFVGFTRATPASNAHISHSALGWARTPATAPRRVTLLQSTRGEKKIGDVWNLQNITISDKKNLCYSTGKKVNDTCPRSSTRGFSDLATTNIEQNKNKFLCVDNVSQKLFPEE